MAKVSWSFLKEDSAGKSIVGLIEDYLVYFPFGAFFSSCVPKIGFSTSHKSIPFCFIAFWKRRRKRLSLLYQTETHALQTNVTCTSGLSRFWVSVRTSSRSLGNSWRSRYGWNQTIPKNPQLRTGRMSGKPLNVTKSPLSVRLVLCMLRVASFWEKEQLLTCAQGTCFPSMAVLWEQRQLICSPLHRGLLLLSGLLLGTRARQSSLFAGELGALYGLFLEVGKTELSITLLAVSFQLQEAGASMARLMLCVLADQ